MLFQTGQGILVRIGLLGLGPINLEGYMTLGTPVEECIMFMPHCSRIYL